MFSRRTIVATGAILTLARRGLAQSAPDDGATIVPPQEAHKANFAGIWTQISGPEIVPLAAAPDLEPGYAETFGSVILDSADSIESYFQTKAGSGFIDWFNKYLANKGDWLKTEIGGSGHRQHFTAFWNSFLAPSPRSLMEFLAYMAMFINECAGNLVNQTEGFGYAGHKGISYLFDVVEIKSGTRTYRKASYNTGKANRSAGKLFRDNSFNAAHGSLPYGDALRNTTDAVWDGSAYPQQSVPTNADYGRIGYILAADFFKFRGRGLVQTTWRDNYAKLVPFVSGYSGNSKTVQGYAKKWAGLGVDEILTRSLSTDWDNLFDAADSEMLCAAVRQHASDYKYLPVSSVTDEINSEEEGSLYFMGKKVGGDASYGNQFKGRVRAMCLQLGK